VNYFINEYSTFNFEDGEHMCPICKTLFEFDVETYCIFTQTVKTLADTQSFWDGISISEFKGLEEIILVERTVVVKTGSSN
jgi:hypothetical protein